MVESSLLSSGALNSPPQDLLCEAIKRGNTTAAKALIAQFPDVLHAVDTADGATAAHWAALFGNTEVLELLLSEGALVDARIDSSGMQPIHWASTRGHVDVVKMLLSKSSDINEVDIKQTTPLVIAAQYDHTVLVFYLVKHGADISRLDDCQDSALHWAAYKGNLQTAALLHYLGLPADAADTYGSTPMHLAAARNAPQVIEYLIDESTSSVEKLVTMKDAKGRTPFEVAKERGNTMAMRLLLKANPTFFVRVHQALMGNDGSKVMFYFYLINGGGAYVIYALYLAPSITAALPLVAAWQHYAYLAINVLMQISYLRVNQRCPGLTATGIEGRQQYEEALQKASEGTLPEANSMPLCHTCRIVKPLRSKHCHVRKRCVPMFDHYCPYINNTIGGGNYWEFCVFIFVGMFGVGTTFAAAVQYLMVVNSKDPLVWFVAVDFFFATLMALMMNNYHLSLTLRNLTTNEDMNKHRYHYLKNDLNQYHNPFSRGPWGNCIEFWGRGDLVRKNPYAHSEAYQAYLKAADVEMGDLTDGASSDGASDNGDSYAYGSPHSHGHSHGHK